MYSFSQSKKKKESPRNSLSHLRKVNKKKAVSQFSKLKYLEKRKDRTGGQQVTQKTKNDNCPSSLDMGKKGQENCKRRKEKVSEGACVNKRKEVISFNIINLCKKDAEREEPKSIIEPTDNSSQFEELDSDLFTEKPCSGNGDKSQVYLVNKLLVNPKKMESKSPAQNWLNWMSTMQGSRSSLKNSNSNNHKKESRGKTREKRKRKEKMEKQLSELEEQYQLLVSCSRTITGTDPCLFKNLKNNSIDESMSLDKTVLFKKKDYAPKLLITDTATWEADKVNKKGLTNKNPLTVKNCFKEKFYGEEPNETTVQLNLGHRRFDKKEQRIAMEETRIESLDKESSVLENHDQRQPGNTDILTDTVSHNVFNKTIFKEFQKYSKENSTKRKHDYIARRMYKNLGMILREIKTQKISPAELTELF